MDGFCCLEVPMEPTGALWSQAIDAYVCYLQPIPSTLCCCYISGEGTTVSACFCVLPVDNACPYSIIRLVLPVVVPSIVMSSVYN